MPRWNAREIVEAFRNSHMTVEGPMRTMGGGRPGVFYVLTREPSNEDLARITNLSGDREVNLMRVNDCFLITVHGGGHGTVRFPSRGGGIEEVQWIAHTHPMEHRDNIPRPTPTDWASLRRFHALAGSPSRGVDSRVVACRDGRVVMVTPFHYEPPPTLESVRGP